MTNPFASSESTPALSFKAGVVEVGTVQRVRVTDDVQVLQETVFGTDGEKAYWPGKNGERGNPKMAAVVTGETVGVCYTKDGRTDEGTRVSVWASLPSDLAAKINEAQAAHGPKYVVKPGDELAIKLTAREPSGKGNPRNVYAVKITPGMPPASNAFAAPAGGDPWGDTTPAAPAAGFGDTPPF